MNARQACNDYSTKHLNPSTDLDSLSERLSVADAISERYKVNWDAIWAIVRDW